MILPDVNVLVYAYREDALQHGEYRDWLENTIQAEEPFGMADLVLSGFVRIVTHPKVFVRPSASISALRFVRALRDQPNCVPISAGPGHWDIFTRLVRETDARGNLVPDAYLAALAIASGCEWVSTDRDFSRFAGLRFRHPLV